MMKATSAIRRFIRLSFFSFKATYGYLDPYSFVVGKVMTPIFQMAFFCLVALHVHDYASIPYYVISNAYILCIYSAFYSVGHIITYERIIGTLKYSFISPLPGLLIISSKALLHILDSLVTILIGLTFGLLFFRVPLTPEQLTQILVGMITVVFSATAFGLLWGSFGFVSPNMNFLMNVLALLVLAFSGANYRIDLLPWVLQRFSVVFPATKIIKSLDAYLEKGTAMYEAAASEFLLGLLYFALGLGVFTYCKKLALKKGSIDLI